MNILNFKKTKERKYIFIVGTGRSGTHLLGRTLSNCDIVDDYIEDSKYFKNITDLIVSPNRDNNKLISVLKDYHKYLSKSHSRIVLDKTHPNLWAFEEINRVFKNTYFIGIKRNIYATVNSMLNHEGVLKWYEKIDLSKPNPFFGITDENKDIFSNIPVESKCALRCKSHFDEIDRLGVNKQNFLSISYEDFYKSPSMLKSKINDFLYEELNFSIESLNVNGNIKWKKQLTENQIFNINKYIH